MVKSGIACADCIYKRNSYCSKRKVARLRSNKCSFRKTFIDTCIDLQNEIDNLQWYYDNISKTESVKLKIDKLKEKVEKLRFSK